jgi:membrane-bound metal-dependent hydrolase YbcI (DUF457 family)
MFVGHYGISFAVQRINPNIPLWVLFIGVQLLDVFWAPFVLVGIEKVRIVPGITASNPLDLYYMPYTHSLVAAVAWSVAAAALYRLWRGSGERSSIAAALVGLAVFSHWILDFVVHRPDLPLYDDTAKVGLGLWNRPALALGLEASLLFGGMWLFLRQRTGRTTAMLIFGIVILAVQTMVFFGPPPPSEAAAAITALLSYGLFAAFIARWEARHPVKQQAA